MQSAFIDFAELKSSAMSQSSGENSTAPVSPRLERRHNLIRLDGEPQMLVSPQRQPSGAEVACERTDRVVLRGPRYEAVRRFPHVLELDSPEGTATPLHTAVAVETARPAEANTSEIEPVARPDEVLAPEFTKQGSILVPGRLVFLPGTGWARHAA